MYSEESSIVYRAPDVVAALYRTFQRTNGNNSGVIVPVSGCVFLDANGRMIAHGEIAPWSVAQEDSPLLCRVLRADLGRYLRRVGVSARGATVETAKARFAVPEKKARRLLDEVSAAPAGWVGGYCFPNSLGRGVDALPVRVGFRDAKGIERGLVLTVPKSAIQAAGPHPGPLLEACIKLTPTPRRQ